MMKTRTLTAILFGMSLTGSLAACANDEGTRDSPVPASTTVTSETEAPQTSSTSVSTTSSSAEYTAADEDDVKQAAIDYLTKLVAINAQVYETREAQGDVAATQVYFDSFTSDEYQSIQCKKENRSKLLGKEKFEAAIPEMKETIAYETVSKWDYYDPEFDAQALDEQIERVKTYSVFAWPNTQRIAATSAIPDVTFLKEDNKWKVCSVPF